MFGLGGSEVLVIALVALLVFGPGRIPEVVRTIARGYKELARLRQQVDSTVAELRQDINLSAELEDLSPRPAALSQPRPGTSSPSAPPAAPTGADSDDYLAAGAGEQPAPEAEAKPAEPPAEDRL
jgi:TatA/E family protein of Tat protein translocase